MSYNNCLLPSAVASVDRFFASESVTCIGTRRVVSPIIPDNWRTTWHPGRSSALSIGESIRSTVRKAARFAVYEEIMISVKNHHIPATILVDTALKIENGFTSSLLARSDHRKYLSIIKKERCKYASVSIAEYV
nr:unnamed protein product [Callosobruchus chinensis]